MADTADMAPAKATNSTRRASANGAAPAARRRSTTRAKTDDLEAQVAQLQNDIRSITRSIASMGEHRVDQVRSAAKSQASNLFQRGQEAFSGAQDEFGEVEKQIKDTIRAKPLTAVAGAVALGFLIAMISR